jgi:hypothetical protein
MKRHHFFVFLAVLALLLVMIFLLDKKPGGASVLSPTPPSDQVVASITNGVRTNSTASDDSLGANAASRADRLSWELEQRKKDPYYEYKLPISFFGRVLDDQGQPVAGAGIGFVWVDLSSEGTSQRNVTSDQNGYFSLSGATGKTLTVAVSKEGYRAYYSSNQFGFDYSVMSSPSLYYRPDPMNPVIFVLRKNREAENLLEYDTRRVEVEQNQSKQFAIGPNDAILLFERMTNPPDRGGWIGRVSVPGGGLLLTTDEFPYEAPDDGYVDSIIITNGTPKPPNWPSDSGAMLYFKTQQGYGRVMVRYISNMSRMFVTSYFNPNSNSRNLEIDPSKIQIVGH